MDDLQEDDGEFVSIDLNDDTEECDICHQSTEEKIVRVILSDEFTLFEGSYDKYAGMLTKVHQICLDKWAEIIERNLKLSKRNDENFNKKPESDCNLEKTRTSASYSELEHNQVNQSHVFMSGINAGHVAKEMLSVAEKKNKDELLSMNCGMIRNFLSDLDESCAEASKLLVEELQHRDKLNNEISGQRSLIGQLVKLQNDQQNQPNAPTIPGKHKLHIIA